VLECNLSVVPVHVLSAKHNSTVISNTVSSAWCLVYLFLIVFDKFLFDMNSAEIVAAVRWLA